MTPFYAAWASSVVVVASALLLHAAWTDLREYRIRNEMALALATLFLLHAVLAGTTWAELKLTVPFAALMFAAMLAAYGLRLMGGGDVKLLGVAFLWTGLAGALPFAVLLGLFGGAHGLAAKYGWARCLPGAGGHLRIAFAPSIAGALIATFMLRAALPAGWPSL